jgi:hypothetical protein
MASLSSYYPQPVIAGTTAGTYAEGDDSRISQLGAGSEVTSTGSTTARSLANRFADIVNVRDFGAVGDGVVNDGPAIRSAASEALTSGKPLYFPSGKYLISTDTLGNALVQSGLGYGVSFVNSSTTTPLKLKIIGHNAEIISPITGSIPSNTFIAFYVRGWFDSVHIEGLKFICSTPTPLTNGTSSRRFAVLFDPHIKTYPQDENVDIQLKTIPTNVKVLNCLFKDWTQGINVWHAKNINISNNYFSYTYGQLSGSGPSEEWTVGIGCRSIQGGLIVNNNFWNGWESENDDGYPAGYTDKRCADGLILCSGFLPVGSGRAIISNNHIQNFQREGILLNWTTLYPDGSYETNVGVNEEKTTHIISNNYINGRVPNFVNGTTNWGIVTNTPHVIINGNNIELANSGILAAINKGGQPFVSDRERRNPPASHGVIINNNNIQLNGGAFGVLSNVVCRGISVGGDNVLVFGNQIKGWNLYSSNDSWDGNYNDSYGTSYDVNLAAFIEVQGSQTGVIDPLKKYPNVYIKNNLIKAYSHALNSFSCAFNVSAGDKYVLFEDNIVHGCSFGFFGSISATYTRAISKNNTISYTKSLVAHNKPDNSGSFVQLIKHVHTFYPTSTGWHQLRMGQNRHGGCANMKIWTSADGRYADYTVTAKNRMAVSALLNYSKSTTQDFNMSAQSVICDSDAPITKIHAEYGSNNLLLFLHVDQVLTRVPLLFSSGSAAGYVDVVDGVIQGPTATITNGGSGYSIAPDVYIDQAKYDIFGSGAQLTANLVSGSVDSVTVVNGGSNYAAPIYLEWDSFDTDTQQGFYVYDIRKAASPLPTPTASGREIALSNGIKSVRMSANSTALSGVGQPIVDTSAPSTTPEFIGQQYIDTDTGIAYLAAGTSSSSDWKAISFWEP